MRRGPGNGIPFLFSTFVAMPMPRAFFLTSLLVGLWFSSAAVAMTANQDRLDEPGKMPLSYQIDDVSIHLSRQAGNAAYAPWRVTLSGDGWASLEHQGKQVKYRYPRQDLVALLNELHKIHFFELPARYATSYKVFLKDDGSVTTVDQYKTSSDTHSVCVAIAKFEKCVRYGDNDGPLELDQIAQRLFTEAEQRAKQQ